MAKTLLLAFLLAFAGAAWTKEAAPAAEDPALERRVMDLAAQLRCLVCQNQSLAESDADLANDMRDQIREKLQAGQSERDVVDFLVARYGDFVLWSPPFKATTVLLWVGPVLLPAAGLITLFWLLGRRRDEGEAELSEADHARAALLLDSTRRMEK